MTDDLYRETIVAEARNPQNYGPLAGAEIKESHVNPACGDSVEVYVKLDQEKKKIVELGWEGNGCVISMASMSFLSARVQGMAVAEIRQLTAADLKEILGVTKITPAREKCMLMGLVAIQKAIS